MLLVAIEQGRLIRLWRRYAIPDHSIEESPCFPIIGSRPGEISTDIIYYCKLHPELRSTFLPEIVIADKKPDIHTAAILVKPGKSA